MDNNFNTKCPFNGSECTRECALYIHSDELNESVRNKLASLGVISKEKGMCSYKNIAMSMSRHIFENTVTNMR